MQKIKINLTFIPPLSLGGKEKLYEFIEFEGDNPTISNLIKFLRRVYEMPMDQLGYRIIAKNGRAVGFLYRDDFKPYRQEDTTLSKGDSVSFYSGPAAGG